MLPTTFYRTMKVVDIVWLAPNIGFVLPVLLPRAVMIVHEHDQGTALFMC